jgi:hypothetical protein
MQALGLGLEGLISASLKAPNSTDLSIREHSVQEQMKLNIN